MRLLGTTLAVLALGAAACGGGGGDGTATPGSSTTTERATTIDAVVSLLAAKGITCAHVDIENEPAAGVPGDAMCTRAGARTLELVVYHADATRESVRARWSQMPCADIASMKALDGRTMTMAEGDGFDVRAADSQSLTPEVLDAVNAETEKVAKAAGLRIGSITLRCATSSSTVVTTKIATARSPGAIAYDGTAAWVTDAAAGSLWRIDAVSARATALAVGGRPSGIASAGTNLWISDARAATVSRIAPDTGARTDFTVATPGATLVSDGRRVWAVGAGTVTAFDATSGARTDQVLDVVVGTVAVAGGDVWVTLPMQHAIARLVR